MGAILYLFDIDGTLLHAAGSGRAAFDAVFAAHHGVSDASDGIRYGGKTDPGIVSEIFAARLGRSPSVSELAAFLDAYIPALDALLAARPVTVLAGVIDALDFLARDPTAVLGIATGNIARGAAVKLGSARLSERFALGGYGDDSPVRSELVAIAIARGRAHRTIREVVVVGDTIHDIAAARACGATVCAVATGSDPATALTDADAVFASMRELPAWHRSRFG